MSENPYVAPASQLNDTTVAKGWLERPLISFLRHWNGRARLASAFWGHFVLGKFLFGMVLVILARAINGLPSGLSGLASVFQVSFLVVSFIYYICTVRFIWACARNSNYSGFFYIVRGLILACLIFLLCIFAITGYEALSR